MKFIYAIIPFVNLATNEFVGGATHALLNKIVIATPPQGTCHDNIINGATTLRVDSPTFISDTPPTKQTTSIRYLPVEDADDVYAAHDNMLHNLDTLINTFDDSEQSTQYEPFNYEDSDEYEELVETLPQLQHDLETAGKIFLAATQRNHIAFEVEDEYNTDEEESFMKLEPKVEDEYNTDEEESSMKLEPTEVTAADIVLNDSAQRTRIGTNKIEIEQWNCVETKTTEVEQRKRIGTQTTDVKQRNCIGTKTTDVEQRKCIGPKMNDVDQQNIIGTNSGVQAKPWSFMIDEGYLVADIPVTLMHSGDQMGLYGSQWNPGIDRGNPDDSVTKTTLDYPNDVGDNLVTSLIVKWTSFVLY